MGVVLPLRDLVSHEKESCIPVAGTLWTPLMESVKLKKLESLGKKNPRSLSPAIN